MAKSENIQASAEKVETLCDHLLAKVDKDGSDDAAVLQALREEAADISTGIMFPDITPLKGLAEVLR